MASNDSVLIYLVKQLASVESSTVVLFRKSDISNKSYAPQQKSLKANCKLIQVKSKNLTFVFDFVLKRVQNILKKSKLTIFEVKICN